MDKIYPDNEAATPRKRCSVRNGRISKLLCIARWSNPATSCADSTTASCVAVPMLTTAHHVNTRQRSVCPTRTPQSAVKAARTRQTWCCVRVIVSGLCDRCHDGAWVLAHRDVYWRVARHTKSVGRGAVAAVAVADDLTRRPDGWQHVPRDLQRRDPVALTIAHTSAFSRSAWHNPPPSICTHVCGFQSLVCKLNPPQLKASVVSMQLCAGSEWRQSANATKSCMVPHASKPTSPRGRSCSM